MTFMARVPQWLIVVSIIIATLITAGLGTGAAVLGGIAQNRMPTDTSWTGVWAYLEFWVALANGLIALGGATAATALAGQLVAIRREAAERRRALHALVEEEHRLHEARAVVDREERDLVMVYLRRRIQGWDVSEWGPEVPASRVERNLTATSRAGRSDSSPQVFSETSALDGRRLLVVLGGPGSGKTWLARRFARRAAEDALKSLKGGALLVDVEIPVYTTWDKWAGLADGRSGGVRASIVASSWDADVHHGGGESANDHVRLKEILNRSDVPVLLVLDSLDEATGRDHSARVTNLVSLARSSTRIVITSRPAAWAQFCARLPLQDESCLVVELQDLAYPDDVEAFIASWFGDDPTRGQGLARQLNSYRVLARAATVPLILTFYCIVASDGDPGAPLPHLRHHLYERIIDRSLARANQKVGLALDERRDERLEQLLGWAWHAVGDSNSLMGLGDWGETFVPDGSTDPRDRLALDALAPGTELAGSRTVRRFQHRTILEHLVAEHLGSLPTQQAFKFLLPHLWFDPDWEVAAPAALAAHNRNRPGELLDQVLSEMNPIDSSANDSVGPASEAIIRVILTAAADSEPEEWKHDHQELVRKLRPVSLDLDPGLAARTASWVSGPDPAYARAVDLLTTAESRVFAGQMVDVLSVLESSGESRSRAIRAMLHYLASSDSVAVVAEVVTALLMLQPSDRDRSKAVTAVLRRMTTTDDGFAARSLTKVLPMLDPSEQDRSQAIAAVMYVLTAHDATVTVEVARVLPALGPSGWDRAQAVDAVLRYVTTTGNAFMARQLVEALPPLLVFEGDRERAIDAVLRYVATTGDAFIARQLVEALPPLLVFEGDRVRAIDAVLRHVATTGDAFMARRLVEALPALEPLGRFRAQAAAIVLHRLANTDAESAVQLIKALLTLEPSEHDRVRALAAVLCYATTSEDAYTVGRLAEVLPTLTVSEWDRAQVVTVVLHQLTTNAFAAFELAAMLPVLGLSEHDRVFAVTAVLRNLTTTGLAYKVTKLVAVLLALEPSQQDRAQALTAVLRSMAFTDDPYLAGELAEALPTLVVSEQDRAQAAVAVLRAVTTTDDLYRASQLAKVLPVLGLSDQERAQAVTAVLQHLTITDDWFVANDLAETALALAISEQDRAQLVTAILHRLATTNDVSWVGWLDTALPELGLSDQARARALTNVLEYVATTGGAYRAEWPTILVSAIAEDLPDLIGLLRDHLVGRVLHPDLVRPLRRLMPVTQWLNLVSDDRSE